MANSGSNSSNKKGKVNPLELLRDGGGHAANTIKEQVITPTSRDILDQIFGRKQNFSGEIMPGESLEMKDVYSGKRHEEENTRIQVQTERRLRQEESVYMQKRMGELRVQIQAIHEEVVKIAKVTPELSREVEIAAIQAPGSPSTYELFFLTHILEFLKSFRKKIENANVWMHTANKRAQKKNVWGANYKKGGAKYLLSGEHYLSRSAG